MTGLKSQSVFFIDTCNTPEEGFPGIPGAAPAGVTAGDGKHIRCGNKSEKAMARFTTLQALTVLTIAMAFTPLAAADLTGYVTTDDPAYRWERLTHTDRHDGLTVYELALTSQVWQGTLWRHRLRVITPTTRQPMPPLALLIISGSGDGARELHEGALMARETGAPVAILHDIPNQPLFGDLVEDDLLAYTFVKFLETHDPTWPLLLPMVKGAVKAMDAVQAFLPHERQSHVSGFLISGASKRGWTAWLTPVVDARVKAIAPLVYDNLHLAQQLRHQRETWGHFSGQIAEYTERGLPQRLLAGDKGALALAAIVDPFTYRQRITVPKFIILGTNDRYWPLDALNLYYDALIGETYILYVPNAGHELGAGRAHALAGLTAFFQKSAGGLTFPKLTWQFNHEASTISLTLYADLQPRAVRVWIANSPTRDFRDATWEAFEMTPQPSGYVYTRDKPTEGAVALFGEAVYASGAGSFSLSTTVRIFP
jgi:PhoPQ-activated pathogenicity-related protein